MVARTAPRPAESDTGVVRPPLKWAGGKRWLVPYLKPLWEQARAVAGSDEERRLVEPLCGGLAMALGLLPQQALLNDLNPHNVNFFRWLQRGLEVDIAMENERVLYDRHRARFNALIDEGGVESKEAAELFYYLNRTCYNGLCRFNRQGHFNVPFGRHNTIKYAQDFPEFPALMADWQFTTGDFESIALRPDDFIYADPPYDVEFTQYSKEAFGWDEQVRLAEWLAAHPGPVVLSNQATPRVVKLYEDLGFSLEMHQAPRMISCNGDRTKATEVVAMRNLKP
ncbi:MAG: DNA adenine methylase [Dehalococcoidia bacterium]